MVRLGLVCIVQLIVSCSNAHPGYLSSELNTEPPIEEKFNTEPPIEEKFNTEPPIEEEFNTELPIEVEFNSEPSRHLPPCNKKVVDAAGRSLPICNCSGTTNIPVAIRDPMNVFGYFSNIFGTIYNFFDLYFWLDGRKNPDSRVDDIQKQVETLIKLQFGKNDIDSSEENELITEVKSLEKYFGDPSGSTNFKGEGKTILEKKRMRKNINNVKMNFS